MSRSLTAQDRASLIRLASTLPAGSPERKVILAQLGKGAGRTASRDNILNLQATKLAENVVKMHGGFLPRPAHLQQAWGGGVEVWIGVMTPHLRNLFETSETGTMDDVGNAEAESISKGLAKAFRVSASSVHWEAQDSVGYIFTVDVGA